MADSAKAKEAALPLARFKFSLKTTSPLILPPYKGAVFRDAFGSVFRQIVCANPKWKCANCLLLNECIFPAVFNPRPPPDFPDAAKFSPAPPPFVLNPPLDNRQLLHPDETLQFELVLMGRFIDTLPYFVLTFNEIGRRGLGKDRGKFTLKHVDLVNGDTAIRIYDDTSQILSTFSVPETLFEASYAALEQITIQFLTPLRLKERGKLVNRLNFSLFFERMTQRLALLIGLYGKKRKMPNFTSLLTAAQHIHTVSDKTYWYEWDRYSGRQKASMKLGGLRGKITFSGVLNPFMPWIRLGERVNIGQGTSFGLGKIKLCLENG
ncbi:MAG: CRISPR system precrRNA processing endoribonuclease RAMP protein Cas6 [Deltaproteobacteria bacterium]|nr:CRISPR system precrRNA processing endoribonuclease RAMP protein Cas6 [Deltaproteobacteria bacterium]MBW2152400.1 CRISPR system precrRNA processing endoribonuclease RAMP protein Cas6 [Deltaproteobacteria bacterium]